MKGDAPVCYGEGDGWRQAKAWASNVGKAPPLTAAVLNKRLNLCRRAREDAARNYPVRFDLVP